MPILPPLTPQIYHVGPAETLTTLLQTLLCSINDITCIKLSPTDPDITPDTTNTADIADTDAVSVWKSRQQFLQG
jgi:hypothetical protein